MGIPQLLLGRQQNDGVVRASAQVATHGSRCSMSVSNVCRCVFDELWKPIPEQPNYWISSKGRIRYVGEQRPSRVEYPRAVKVPHGYLVWHYRSDGRVQMARYIHRLVAAAFLANPQSKPNVNHLDGCKTHNCVANLQWVTYSENLIHAYQAGLHAPIVGATAPWTKLTWAAVQDIRTSLRSAADLAADYKISRKHVLGLRRRDPSSGWLGTPPGAHAC